jgi:type VI secretion system protein
MSGRRETLARATPPTEIGKRRPMTLRLRIVSDHRRSLGDRSSIVLGIGGGTIGRSADNDWVLPDPLRYVSAHHARISHRGGHYYFEDVSTNGSFLNDDHRPIGRQPHLLRNGDLLRLGEYHIVAALEPEAASVDRARTTLSEGVPTSINALQPLSRVSQTDIGAQLNVNDLLVFEESTHGSAPRPVAGSAQSLLSDEPSDSGIARRIARLAKAVGRNNRGPNGAPAEEFQSGLEAFCRGAGIEADKLPADAQTRLLHVGGVLLREALLGLKDLERARGEIRNRFRIEIPTDADDPRPSLAKLAVDELVVRLFNQHETRSVDAIQWLRDTVASAREHEAAMTQAMRKAFVEFLDRIDPAELEARFERAARRGKAQASDRTKYWDLYTQFYRTLIEMPAEDQLPHAFVEAFATAYREIFKKAP